MKRRTLKILAVAAIAAVLCSCGSMTDSYIAADKATYDAVAPEYLDYVRDDQSLDQAGKDRRRRTIETWEKRIQAADYLRSQVNR